MTRKILTLALACVFALAWAAPPALAASQAVRNPQTPEEVKIRINRAGLGERARVTVWRRDGTKLKGYVAERRESEFELRDRKTDAPTIIPYADVAKVDINRCCHSNTRQLVGVIVIFSLLIGSAAAAGASK
jgi:hypothetical protein